MLILFIAKEVNLSWKEKTEREEELEENNNDDISDNKHFINE